VMPIKYTTARNDQHLFGILDLQRRNLATVVDPDEKSREGFVTVQHHIGDLRKMNAIEKQVIALDNDQVVAYLLVMTRASRNDIPVLVPMFDMIEALSYRGEPLATCSYVVVGQACVGKGYRGKGTFDAIYRYYLECFRDRYRYVITEIDATNVRSLRAHNRVGFHTIHEYTAPDGVVWNIVLWDWND